MVQSTVSCSSGWPAISIDFVVPLELAPPLRRQVLARLRAVGLEQDDVAPVGVGVGEPPRDVRVAADHERRHARQRHADEAPRLARRSTDRGHSSEARYQVFGTRIPRCMSLATSAPPSAVRLPATAKLLLPMAASAPRLPTPNRQRRTTAPAPECSRHTRRERGVGRGKVAGPLSMPAGAQVVHVGTRNRAAWGTRRPRSARPIQSRAAPENRTPAPASTSCIVPSVDSYEPSVSCSVMNIDSTTSRLSSGTPRRPDPGGAPGIRTEARQRPKAGVDAGGIRVEHRAIAGSQQRKGAPRLGAEPVHADLAIERRARAGRPAPPARRRPAAARGPSGRSGPGRGRNRWRAPRRRASAPRMVGMPRASRATVTGAESPATWRSPSSCARLPRSSARAHAAAIATATASRTSRARSARRKRRIMHVNISRKERIDRVAAAAQCRQLTAHAPS